MEVLVGPTYDMEVSSAASSSSSSSSSSNPSCVRDRTIGVPSAPTPTPTPTPTPAPVPAQVQDRVASSSCLFLNDNDEEEEEGGDRKIGEKFVSVHGSDDSPESSSSIGVPGDSEDENDEVSSNEGEELHRNKFSMDLFEDNLPIKRGLSNHYIGKSKSFGNLLEVTTVKDLEKAENPFNKRRRVLITSKLWSRNSFYSRPSPKSMPLLPILPDEDDDDDDDEVEDEVLDEDDDQHQAKH